MASYVHKCSLNASLEMWCLQLMYGSQWPGFVSYFIRQKIFVFVFHNQGGHFFFINGTADFCFSVWTNL